MGMIYNTGLDFAYKDEFDFSKCLEIPGECSFSVGKSIETMARYSYDYSRTSQSIMRCRRPQAKTYSVSYTIARPQYLDLFEAVALAEDCAGKTGNLYYSGLNLGLVIIASVSISITPECSDGISEASISMDIREALEPLKPAQRLKINTYRGQE